MFDFIRKSFKLSLIELKTILYFTESLKSAMFSSYLEHYVSYILMQHEDEILKSVPSAFEKLIHEVFFMNENHLQRSSLRKLFQNGCKFNKNDYSERKSSEKGKSGYHFYTDVSYYRR